MNAAQPDPPDSSAGLVPRKVRMGGTTKPELMKQLRSAGVELNAYAQALFDDSRFSPANAITSVGVTALSVADLGLPDGARFAEILARAEDLGLSPCPLEMGPHLRLQFLQQVEASVGHPATAQGAPAGSLTVASLPLDDSDETPKGFYLRRVDGRLWLRGYRSWPGHVWSPCDQLVFVSAAPT